MSNPRYRESAIDIHDSGTHLLSLINDILDLSQIEAGTFALPDDAVDLAAGTTSSFRILRARAEAAGAVLTHRFPYTLPTIQSATRRVTQPLPNPLYNTD